MVSELMLIFPPLLRPCADAVIFARSKSFKESILMVMFPPSLVPPLVEA